MLCWPGAEQGVLNDSVDNFKKVLDTFFFFFLSFREKQKLRISRRGSIFACIFLVNIFYFYTPHALILVILSINICITHGLPTT